jgi:uncharacterized membrane protein
MKVLLERYLAIIVVLGLGAILRLPHLTDSFWLDEAAQVIESSRPFAQQFNLVDDFQPPLLHLIVHGSLLVSGSEWWLRLWGALIPALFTIWGTYVLGRKIVSQKVGLLAAVLLATSSFHIFFSQELRPYSLSAAFAVWAWFFLLEAEKIGQDMYQLSPRHFINKFFNLFPISRDFFLFLLLTILGLYTS